MPQDTWSYYGKKLAVPDTIQKKGIAASSDAVYVGVTTGTSSFTTTSIQKYSAAGAYLSTFSTTFTDVTGMACDSAGNLYVFDRGQTTLNAFDASGTLLWTKGSAGNGQGQFSVVSATSQHAHLAIDENDRIYVLDRGNSRVQVYDNLGNWLRMWGGAGTAAGKFLSPFGIAARNGRLVAVDTLSGVPPRSRIQQFTTTGVYLSAIGNSTEPGAILRIEADRFSFSPDGLLATTSGFGLPSTPLFDSSLTSVGQLPLPTGISTTTTTRLGATFTPSGDFWCILGAQVWLQERRYASTDNPITRNALPLPQVTAVSQRAASTLLDIDFKVIDTDASTVEVAALGFVNGGDTLADVLRLSTLVEGTASNVGPGQPTNVAKRLTWNAAADWSSSFGEIQVEILAKDQRDLLGTHWITVPASGGVPVFQASAKPVADEDLLSIWYWLIAKGDSAIALVNGEVKGVGGTYDMQILASGAATTLQGRAFLYARLGVRAITTGELASLQSGNYGFSSSSTDTVVKP